MNEIIRIAICDDEIVWQEKIQLECNKYFYNRNIFLRKFSSGGELLSNLGDSYDIVFLDVELDDTNGINVKDALEIKGCESFIIFVTSHKEYMCEAFGKNVMGYISKPIDTDILFRHLDKIMNIRKQNRNCEFITILDEVVHIKMSDIIYVCSEHTVYVIYTVKGERIVVRGSLSDAMDILDDTTFFTVSRSCILNYHYIKEMKRSNEVILKNGEKVAISRRRWSQFKSGYYEYMKKMARVI